MNAVPCCSWKKRNVLWNVSVISGYSDALLSKSVELTTLIEGKEGVKGKSPLATCWRCLLK